MRYLMRKRLKNPAPLEVTERRQVGDAEALVNPPPLPPSPNQNQHDQDPNSTRYNHPNQRQRVYWYPARASDSEV